MPNNPESKDEHILMLVMPVMSIGNLFIFLTKLIFILQNIIDMSENKVNIRSASSESINDWILKKGHKFFRYKQIHEWLWRKNVSSFESMQNLGKKLINDLEDFSLITSP